MRFRKRYLILLAGLSWWHFFPLGVHLPIEIILTALIYIAVCEIDRAVNPKVPQNNDLARYFSVRNAFQTGDLIAFEGTDLLAKIIRRTQASAYSHVGMVVRLDFLRSADRVFILEAVPKKGVVLMPLSSKLLAYEGAADWIVLQAADPEKRSEILDFLMQQLGKNYDYGDISVFVKKTMFKFFSFHYLVEDSTRLICSELVAKALQACGLAAFASASQVTPGEIVNLAIFSKPGTKII